MKPNYSFQKRQRELAKAQKKEEKQRRKDEAKAAKQALENPAPAPLPPKDPETPA
jgi:hypothetical protein